MGILAKPSHHYGIDDGNNFPVLIFTLAIFRNVLRRELVTFG